MAWWPVERWEALRLALGARGALPREVGTLILPQGCPLVPWRLPPLHRLARFARDWQTSDALRRENADAWPSGTGTMMQCMIAGIGVATTM